MTAADVLVAELKTRDVPFIATLNGHGLDPFYLACQRAGMRMIDVRNEQAAGYMAEVTGRLSRSVGVCAVSGAVAHANGLTGVLNAWFDGAPMLLITGMTPLARLGYGDFQDFNPVPMAAPICKYSRILDVPERTRQIVHDAFEAALSGRPGPVHLALPMDVAAAEVDEKQIPQSRIKSGAVRHGGAAEQELIDEAARQLRRAQRPVLIAGSGVYYACGETALASFVKQQRIPTLIPNWDRGSIVERLEPFMGVVGSASGSPEILPDADLVILAGVEFDYRVGQLEPPIIGAGTDIIRIHSDASRLRQGADVGLSIQASPAKAMEQLTEACRQLSCPPCEEWLREAQLRRDEFRERCRTAADNLRYGIIGRDVVDVLAGVLTDETVVLVDGGNIGQWFHQLALDRYPGHWVSCGASGVIGWGLPGAMAARGLYPNRPIILLSGDGSFTFTVAELECAARQRLPFVCIVAEDECWGISVTGHRKRYGPPLYSDLGPTRLDLVAEGFGCRGIRVEQLDQLQREIEAGLAADRPTVIHVPIVHGGPND